MVLKYLMCCPGKCLHGFCLSRKWSVGFVCFLSRGWRIGWQGVTNSDYRSLFPSQSSDINNYTVTGISNSIIAARVSYVWDLRGPSLVLDTACSSSLIAMHLGIQAIRTGDVCLTCHSSPLSRLPFNLHCKFLLLSFLQHLRRSLAC